MPAISRLESHRCAILKHSWVEPRFGSGRGTSLGEDPGGPLRMGYRGVSWDGAASDTALWGQHLVHVSHCHLVQHRGRGADQEARGAAYTLARSLLSVRR